MFDTLGSFSIAYWILAVILILLVAFEPQLRALEAKYDKRREMKRNEHHKKASEAHRRKSKAS